MEISARNNDNPPFCALIVAGGKGERMGAISDLPKQYMRLGGKTVLRHSIETYLGCEGIRELKVVIHPDHTDLYEKSVQGLSLPPPIYGGEERNISVINGLKSFYDISDETIVAIHDAARPFTQSPQIIDVVRKAEKSGAATLATPVVDTLKHESGDYIDRSGLWAIQTPQAFHYGLILQAHEAAAPGKRYTDDSSIVADFGISTQFVPGPRSNFKITTQDDYELACMIVNKQGNAAIRAA